MNTYRVVLGRLQDHNMTSALGSHKSGSRRCRKTSSNIGRDKSFVYDLNLELRIVSVEVAFVPRPAEIQRQLSDLFHKFTSPS